MSQLIDRLVDLTGHRDRDVLDLTLVHAVRELLPAGAISIHRLVGDAEQQRWATMARLAKGGRKARSTPAGSDFESLPPLGSLPARREALKGQVVIGLQGSMHVGAFPLWSGQSVEGVVEVESDQPIDEHCRRAISSVLLIYRNFRSILDYSERDMLTGLRNRKTFDDSFFKLMAKSRLILPRTDRRHSARQDHRLWLAMIDIDHFKSVNDRFGHLIGDEVLLLLSRVMQGSFRFQDALYRFGGEEFVVMMRCDDEEGAVLALERLRSNTGAFDFPQVGRVTVSIGYTELRVGDSPSAALERADKAVYYAKAHGRNQVRSYTALARQGAVGESVNDGLVEIF